jgi:hypothetical protein
MSVYFKIGTIIRRKSDPKAQQVRITRGGGADKDREERSGASACTAVQQKIKKAVKIKLAALIGTLIFSITQWRNTFKGRFNTHLLPVSCPIRAIFQNFKCANIQHIDFIDSK